LRRIARSNLVGTSAGTTWRLLAETGPHYAIETAQPARSVRADRYPRQDSRGYL
jgi:hypothetical protein